METFRKLYFNESALKSQLALHIRLDLFASQLLKWPAIDDDHDKRWVATRSGQIVSLFGGIVCRTEKNHAITLRLRCPIRLLHCVSLQGSKTMDLVPIFILVLLTIIAITLVIISIKLTDLLAESKASRTAVQNIEADELFRQSYQNQQARLAQAQHTEQILTLLQGMQHLLSSRLRADKTAPPAPSSEKTVLYSAEQEPQHRFHSHSRS